MVDRLSVERRSRLMSRVRGKDTTPELVVRRAAHSLGLRFRLHRKDLPGTPDLVFPGRKAVVFVHGCFWHRHEGCKKATAPKSRQDFWQAKFERNVARDREALAALERRGWRTLVIWQCETNDSSSVKAELTRFFGLIPGNPADLGHP
jgi:DNA mismatch endonuclease, patch repair protein